MKQIERWDFIELRLKAKNSDHPYQKKVQGLFEHAQESVTVDGFYDGDDVYKVRFMPRFTGVYQYTISGDDIPTQTGSFEVVKATGNNHGPVHVANQYHFAYEDGTPHYSMGTTCYAWMHQNENLQLETLKTLQTAGFNKIRCCIFPKHYDYNLAEPLTYPFLRGHKEGLDEAQVKKAIMMPPVENPDGHKLEHRKFCMNTRKNFFTLQVTEHWNKLPREAVKSPSLEIFKTHLDAFLHNQL